MLMPCITICKHGVCKTIKLISFTQTKQVLALVNIVIFTVGAYALTIDYRGHA